MEWKTILPPLLAVPAGVIIYWLTKYWLEPVFNYRRVKANIASDLIYYDNAVEIPDCDGSDLAKKHQEKADKFRRHSALLKAAYYQLPAWHSVKFTDSEEKPLEASKSLMGYSNSTTRELAESHTIEIKHYLKLPF